MSDKEILLACEMRLDGKTWEEIGEKLCFSHATVHETVKNRLFAGKAMRTVTTQHVYVRQWMKREGITGKMLAAESGLNDKTVRANLKKTVISQKLAETICKMSGLTMGQVQEVELR